MQYVTVKAEEKNGKTCFSVYSIPLKNTSNSIVQRIPHPMGTELLEFDTLEDAKDAVLRAGFGCILPNGKKVSQKTVEPKIKKEDTNNDYEQIIFELLKNKANSSNASVCASAVGAISEINKEEAFDILFAKLGEENDIIRKNAISGISRYGNLLIDRIIETMNSDNWVARNSALACVVILAENKVTDLEKFIMPLIKICNDSNTIVQVSAINALGKVYQAIKKMRNN